MNNIELKADKTFVFGEECLAYRKQDVDHIISKKNAEIERLKSDIADLRDDNRYTTKLLDERNAEIADLRAQIQVHT